MLRYACRLYWDKSFSSCMTETQEKENREFKCFFLYNAVNPPIPHD